MASVLIATTSFLRVFSQLLQYLTQRLRFSAHRAALMTKIDLTFLAFSLKFVDFAAQFCFRFKFLFHVERHPAASRVPLFLFLPHFMSTSWRKQRLIFYNHQPNKKKTESRKHGLVFSQPRCHGNSTHLNQNSRISCSVVNLDSCRKRASTHK